MLDLNIVRADFAAHLAGRAGIRHSLDAALMHVVQAAYQKGLEDALQVPPVLRQPIPDVDASLASGNGSAACVEPAALAAAGLPETASGAGQGGCAESGNPAPACGDALKGGALAKLAAMWCGEPRFHAWLKSIARDVWDRHAARAASAQPVGNVDHLIAGNVLREMLGVKTRAELDHTPSAAAAFHSLIRAPYADHIRSWK